MRQEIERRFLQCAMQKKILLDDGEIALRPRKYNGRISYLDGCRSMIFDVVELEEGRTAGELALRVGDGPALFYLGHVGYHIDPPFRGKNYAYKACLLGLPIFGTLGQNTVIVTTDVDNYPSIRTCEKLGCRLESTVNVPEPQRTEFELSARKRRYLYVSFR